jgi:hypothetical protein
MPRLLRTTLTQVDFGPPPKGRPIANGWNGISHHPVSMLRGYQASYKLPTSGPIKAATNQVSHQSRSSHNYRGTLNSLGAQAQSSDSNKSSPSGELSPCNRLGELQSDFQQLRTNTAVVSIVRAHSAPRQSRDRKRKNQQTGNAPLPRSPKRHRTRSPPPRRHWDSSSHSHSSLSPPLCKHHRNSI